MDWFYGTLTPQPPPGKEQTSNEKDIKANKTKAKKRSAAKNSTKGIELDFVCCCDGKVCHFAWADPRASATGPAGSETNSQRNRNYNYFTALRADPTASVFARPAFSSTGFDIPAACLTFTDEKHSDTIFMPDSGNGSGAESRKVLVQVRLGHSFPLSTTIGHRYSRKRQETQTPEKSSRLGLQPQMQMEPSRWRLTKIIVSVEVTHDSTPLSALALYLQKSANPKRLDVPRYRVTFDFLSAEEWATRRETMLATDICGRTSKEKRTATWKRFRDVYGDDFVDRHESAFDAAGMTQRPSGEFSFGPILQAPSSDAGGDGPETQEQNEAYNNFIEQATKLDGGVASLTAPSTLSVRAVMEQSGTIKGCHLFGRSVTVQVYSLRDLEKVKSKFVSPQSVLVKRIRIGGAFPTLKLGVGASMVLVDLPGFGDMDPVRDKVGRTYMDNAARVLACAPAERAGSDSRLLQLLQTPSVKSWHRAQSEIDRGLAFVATKSDAVPWEELERTYTAADSPDSVIEDHVSQIRRHVRDSIRKLNYRDDIPIYVVSALKYETKREELTKRGGGEQKIDAENVAMANARRGWDAVNLENTGLPPLMRFLQLGVFLDWVRRRWLRSRGVADMSNRVMEEVGELSRRIGQPFNDPEATTRVALRICDEMTTPARLTEVAAGFGNKEGKEDCVVYPAAIDTFREFSAELHGGVEASKHKVEATCQSWYGLHHMTFKKWLRTINTHLPADELVSKTLYNEIEPSWLDFFKTLEGQRDRMADVHARWKEEARQLRIAVFRDLREGIQDKQDRERVLQELEVRFQQCLRKLPEAIENLFEKVDEEIKRVRARAESQVKTAVADRFRSEYSIINESYAGRGSDLARKNDVKRYTKENWDMKADANQMTTSLEKLGDLIKSLPEKIAREICMCVQKPLRRATWNDDTCAICLSQYSEDNRPGYGLSNELNVRGLEKLVEVAEKDIEKHRSQLQELREEVRAQAASDSEAEDADEDGME
eukprot:g12370.t1